MPKLVAVVSVGVLIATAAPAAAETPLERGTYLMQSIVACGNCHTPKGPEGDLPDMELAGGFKIEEPPFTVYAPNITPDEETGIGTWTDAEIITSIREGKRPDGTVIGPPMPIGFYRHMSDADAEAIVAYLRSVKPIKNPLPAPADYHIPLPESYGPPVGEVVAPSPDDKLAYGEYLANIGHCMECHTPAGEGGVPDFANRLGAGGFEFHGPWGVSVSANITPAGIGSYSDEELKAIIQTGMRPDGSHVLPPMPVTYYANITPDDMDALVAYLRSLPPK
jgi:mono/diheme cytochrome c family protein